MHAALWTVRLGVSEGQRDKPITFDMRGAECSRGSRMVVPYWKKQKIFFGEKHLHDMTQEPSGSITAALVTEDINPPIQILSSIA